MDEDSKLKKRRKKEKKRERKHYRYYGRCVGRGLYVAGAWGGGTCTAAGSATAAVTVGVSLFDTVM